MQADIRPRERALILRESGRGQQRSPRLQHGREPVEHIRRAVPAVEPVRVDALRCTDCAPRRAAERVGVARAVLNRTAHGLFHSFGDAERVDVRGQVERHTAVGFRVRIHIPAVYIFGHSRPPFCYGNTASFGKSDLREYFTSRCGAFSQQYWMYCKKMKQNTGAKFPQSAAGTMVRDCLSQTAASPRSAG